jgi:hypothetical protein
VTAELELQPARPVVPAATDKSSVLLFSVMPAVTANPLPQLLHGPEASVNVSAIIGWMHGAASGGAAASVAPLSVAGW